MVWQGFNVLAKGRLDIFWRLGDLRHRMECFMSWKKISSERCSLPRQDLIVSIISLIIFGLQIMSLRHYKVSKTIILTTLPGYTVSVYAVNIPDLHRRKLLKLSLSRWADTNWNKALIKLMPLRSCSELSQPELFFLGQTGSAKRRHDGQTMTQIFLNIYRTWMKLESQESDWVLRVIEEPAREGGHQSFMIREICAATHIHQYGSAIGKC